ncbi:MAG: cytidylate kinase family protein [Alphaproteobacteria bacterium]|nr:cytidylate kinase family protein [Alphaproteobacteria bacterium]
MTILFRTSKRRDDGLGIPEPVTKVGEAQRGRRDTGRVTIAATSAMLTASSRVEIDGPRPVRDYSAMKKPIITIAGSLGSGKSSTARAVAAALGFRHFSSGDLFRQLAVERSESIEAMNISAEVQRDIDLKVDNLLQEMYRTDDKLVIDSRMAWHWMPESFKVFLVLDPDTAAARIFGDLQGKGRLSEDATSIEEVRASIDRRFASEQKRYAALYGVNATDLLNFDIVVNTQHNDLKTVTAIVCAAYRAWRADDAN